MEAVERLVEAGIFPKGMIAITESPVGQKGQIYLFISRKKVPAHNLLRDFYEDICSMTDDDDGEDWKKAGVT